MNLTELSLEYLRSAELVSQRLELLKPRLATARGQASIDLKKRVDTLTLELLDLRQLCRFLEEYYA